VPEHPLIATGDLAARLDEPNLRIADCRWYLEDLELGRVNYGAGHIPGAVYIDLEQHLSADEGPGRHPLPTREGFAAAMGAIGFGDDHLIVAYDDRGGAVAARLWWMLRWIGHDRVRVLDGGLTAWEADDRPLTTDVSVYAAATMTVGETSTRTIDRTGLSQRLGTVDLFDARGPERYRGDEEPVDPVAGHIPTAHSRPCEENLASDERFLPAAELAARFATSDPPVLYCGSGVTACHNALAMAVAGLPEPILYPGSWSDWSTVGMPAATGSNPGAP
jgi:thiosulfate/3-mercaptopyruvate sulfurtransferase